MNRSSNQVDLVKMLIYILKHLCIVVLCAEIGFGAVYMHTTRKLPDTYTAQGTMYVNNNNPNLSEYNYTSAGDLNSAVALIKTYLVVVKSDKVMSAVTAKLETEYPGITSATVSSGLTMESVSETGVVAVKSTNGDPRLAADIVNMVMEVAPEEIIRVVGAGNVEIMDYATVPVFPNDKNAIRSGIQKGALAGAVIAIVILAILHLLNQKITNSQDLKDNYTPPVLASIKRIATVKKGADLFILNNQSPMEIIESYAKLRMNLFYTLVGKEKKAVVITSSVSGEGKSTIAANLAISCSMAGKKVLLIDGDMRRASQCSIFKIDQRSRGLSDVVVGSCNWQHAVIKNITENVDLMPSGYFPPNPAELLESSEMDKLLLDLEQVYDLIFIDMPPINIVSDPLVVSSSVAGCIFVTRQDFSDHRDIRRALIAAEMTGMNVLGFVFYGEHVSHGSYYSRRYYKSYYNQYDYRKRPAGVTKEPVISQAVESKVDTTAEKAEEPVQSSYVKSIVTAPAERWRSRRKQNQVIKPESEVSNVTSAAGRWKNMRKQPEGFNQDANIPSVGTEVSAQTGTSSKTASQTNDMGFKSSYVK